MPLYEYRCTACGYSFEKIQSFSATPESECPKCGGELIRPVTAPALRFAGAGWYVNDYAAKGAAKSSDGAGAPEGSGGDAKAGESKAPATESGAPGSGGTGGGSESKAAPAAAPAAGPSAAPSGSGSGSGTGSGS